jgi:hypothetical protein
MGYCDGAVGAGVVWLLRFPSMRQMPPSPSIRSAGEAKTQQLLTLSWTSPFLADEEDNQW